MPEYLSPGVYMEEQNTGPRPIEGVSTSTAGFLGPTERGPEAPRMMISWLDFQRWYGSYLPLTQSYLGYAVQGFFDNGGQRLFVARVVNAGATWARRQVGTLNISAIGRGAWGNNILIRIDAATKRTQNPDWFRLALLYYRDLPNMATFVDPLDPANAADPNRREPDVVEVYDNLTHLIGASNNVEAQVNTASALVRVWFDPAAAPQPVPINVVATFDQLSTAALDGNPVDVADYAGHQNSIDSTNTRTIELFGQGRGLEAVRLIDEVSLVAIPDAVRTTPQDLTPLTDQVINQCEQLKDRFAVVSVGSGQNDEQTVQVPRDTSYAAFYYPWIEIYDPVTRGAVRVPPTGHVTGLIARTDIERGVHKAPANEVVRDATNLEFAVPTGKQDILNPRGVNCIRDFRPDGRGIRLWGARTMSSDPAWRYVNVRRLFLFIEESIQEGTQWVVFEPNDEPLWAQVRRSITNFLVRVWKSGALMGATQDEAFFVKCDRTTMTLDDVENGRLICYIGVAPVRPAEFVIFRISQKTADAPA